MSTKRNFFKSAVMASGIALLVAVFCAFGVKANANTTNSNTVSEAAPTYCWGTLRIVAGIAVCDGAAYNCTHPCVVAEPGPVILAK